MTTESLFRKAIIFGKTAGFPVLSPTGISFALIKGNFFFPEFKFHAQLNTLKKALIFLGPLKGTLN